MTGDTSSLEGMRGLAARIEAEHGPIDHAVVSLGQWWQGRPLWDVTEEEFQHYFVGTATLHFAAACALIPLIKDGGSYTILAGLSAIKPIEGASLIGMAGAAHLMLARELQADLGDRLRVNSLVLGFIRSRGRVPGKPSWLTAEEVGDLTIRIAGSQLGGTQIRADDRTVTQQSLMEFGL